MTGFISTIIIAILVSLIADAIARDKIINGMWGAIPVAILGSWIGAYLPIFKVYGPTVDGVAIYPAIIGSALLIIVLGFFKNAISEISP